MMNSANSGDRIKTLVQCDFDGTITESDISFLLLDAFADGDWRGILEEYKQRKITVGAFNQRAFALVKAGRQSLLDYLVASPEVRVRPGFEELLDYCSQEGVKFVIVSNGLVFYIDAILDGLGRNGIEVFAAHSVFSPGGMQVRYVGPDGRQLDDAFKTAYTELFLGQGYRVVYIGNGVSDMYPARRAHHIFATSDLLDCCRENGMNCTPFDDLHQVIRGLEDLTLSPASG